MPVVQFHISGGSVKETKTHGKHYKIVIKKRTGEKLKLSTSCEDERHEWFLALNHAMYSDIISSRVSQI